jgi:hypothetical protein
VEAERLWLRRAALVLRRPAEAFSHFRGDSEQQAADRQDVVVGLVFVGGIAVALATAGGRLSELGVVEQALSILLAGFAYAFIGYWVLGWAFSWVVPRLGGLGSRRRTRHLLAFALAPLVFALPLWLLWPPLLVALGLWSLALLVEGLRIVEGWTVARAAAGVALTAVWLGALGVGFLSLLALLR